MGGKNKKEHLIRTGQKVILDKGYELSSIKDITTAAGLPKGSFYHYFESKEKFALEAMNNFIDLYQEKLPNNESSLESLQKILDVRINSIIKINFARECYMSVMCHAYSIQEDSFRIEVLNAIETSNETMLNLLVDLKKQKLIKADIDVNELMEFIDFTWRGARLKARLLKSEEPLKIFKKYLFEYILN